MMLVRRFPAIKIVDVGERINERVRGGVRQARRIKD